MSKSLNPHPTDSELEILLVLWANGPSSVRYVNDSLNKKKPVGYTTTLKLMQIMNEKGLTKRDTTNRTHIYSANVQEKETQNKLLHTFLDSAFRGSAMSLVMQTLGNHNTTQDELEQIKAFIQQIENTQS